MGTQEMQKGITRLWLLLATIESKEEELSNLAREFERQLKRAPTNIMSEIQERLDGVRVTCDHLSPMKTRVQAKL